MKGSDFLNKMLDLYTPIIEFQLSEEEVDYIESIGCIGDLVKKMSKIFSRNNRNDYAPNFNLKYTRLFMKESEKAQFLENLHNDIKANYKEFVIELPQGTMVYVLFGSEKI